MIMIRQEDEQRRDEDKAVDPIEHAAVTGDRGAPVLQPKLTLQHAGKEIAELSAQADNQTSENELKRPEMWKGKPQKPRQREGKEERA